MNYMIVFDGNMPVLSPEIADEIIMLEKMVKEITAKEKAVKAAILEAMQANGITKLETPELLINYIAPTDRETFDSKLLRADFPDIYDAYAKISPVAASVRIKVKGEK